MNRYLLEILHVLFKHKLLVIGSFAVIFLSVALGTFLRPHLYRASGRLMITGERTFYRVAPGDSRAQKLDLRDINTEIDNLQSTSFLAKVAASLPFSPNTEESPPAHENGTTASQSPVSQWLSSLRKNLEVVAVPNSLLVEIAYTDTDPERAAAIVNTVLESYPAHQVSLHDNPTALSFYDKQKEQLAQEIATVEQDLRAFADQENIVSLPEQKAQMFALLDKLKDRLQGADLDIEQGKGKIAEIERQLAGQPDTTVVYRETADPETRLIHEKLVTLEIEKNALLQKYTEKDRRVQDKMREITALRERLVTNPTKKVVVGERVGPNAVRQELLRELSEQKVKLGQIYAKREKLARQVEELQTQAAALAAKGYQLQRLQESLANKKEMYLLYSKKAEEARIAAAMNRENLANVKVVDRARVPSNPVATRAALALLLAACVGMGTGVGGALILEYLRPTFHSALDVEEHLELPVLALIPDLQEHA